MPSAAAVLNMSAPNMLLSLSLNAFLIGLGVYFGYVWTRNLDEAAGANGSRAVFITYIVGLLVCYCVYALSRAVVADQSYVNEQEWFDKHVGTGPLPPQREQSGEGIERSIRRNGRRTTAEMTPLPSARLASGQENREPDVERAISVEAVSGFSNGQARQESMFRDEATRKELLIIFQEAAELRKASAQVDARLGRLLEMLGEGNVADS